MPQLQSKSKKVLGLGVSNSSSEIKETRSPGDSKDHSSINSNQNSKMNPLAKKDGRTTKQTNSTKTRIVSSKYKLAASEASLKALANRTSSLSNSGSSFDKLRRRPKGFVNDSMMNLTQLETSDNGKKAKTKNGMSNARLHSTALNSTFFDKTHLSSVDSFSTTVVDHRSPRLGCLGELPDLSQICSSVSKDIPQSENTIILASNEKGGSLDANQLRDFSTEEINAEYLRYLSWANLDVNSEAGFQKQVNKSRDQIFSLTYLIEEEEKKLLEEKKKLELLNHYEQVSKSHALLKEEILKLNETIPPCEDGLDTFCRHLEFQLNQIKLSNIYIPSNEAAYKEELQDALQESCDALQGLNSDLMPQTNRLQSVSDLVNLLTEEIEAIEPCLQQGEKVADLAIQESSLKLSSCEPLESPSND